MGGIPCASVVAEATAKGRSEPNSTRPAPVANGGPRGQASVSPISAIVLAVSLGLCAGYLDVGFIIFKKFCLNPEGYYRIARDFPWSVPMGHAALMVIPGAVVAALGRLSPRIVTLRMGAWLLATLAIWGALLRMPLYGWCSLLLAAGVGRPIGDAIATAGPGSRGVRRGLVAVLGVLGILAAASTGRQALLERRAVAALPAPPRARNVILIVWDTVRADHMSMYKYDRNTTPNLARWAGGGVAYQLALAPAPWTFPSHSCIFTGHWPMKLDTQWKPRLDTPDPTLAEYLASRGYQTAGFAANTYCCTYESGFNRGFCTYEDYSSAPRSLLARTVPGRWLLEQALDLVGDHHARKLVAIQSRDASEINGAFLDWLGWRRPDRPFFAFLNYFDAHDSFVPPPEFLGRFGIRPATRRDYRFLAGDFGMDQSRAPVRDVLMARDGYDSCIAYLDEQLGRLLEELRRRGLLDETDVIITSDHGEAFGEHGTLGHSNSVMLEEVRVPLVILSPDAPTGVRVYHPVSLRDLPATVVDRLGLSGGSPFPGRSLAAYWRLPPGRMPAEPTTPAFSEQANRTARTLLRPLAGPGGPFPGFRMSLVLWNHHYIRDGEGGEEIYDLPKDPLEKFNAISSPDYRPIVEAFRTMLLDVLTESPGSTAVERAYLRDYRESLEALVRRGSAGRAAGDPRIGPDRAGESPGAASRSQSPPARRRAQRRGSPARLPGGPRDPVRGIG